MKPCKKDGTFVVTVQRGKRRRPDPLDVSFACERHLMEMVRRAIPQSNGHRVVVAYSPCDDWPCEMES